MNPLFHGSKGDRVQSILDTGILRPRLRHEEANHPAAPSQAGQLYLTKYPGLSGEQAFPKSGGGFSLRPHGAAQYGMSGHIFEVDPNSVNESALSPDEDFVASGLSDTLLQKHPEVGRRIAGLLAEEIERVAPMIEKEAGLQKGNRFADEAARALTWSKEALLEFLDGDAQRLDWAISALGIAWANGLMVRAYRLGHVTSLWDADTKIRQLSGAINRRLAREVADMWPLSLEQFGTVRSSEPVAVQRAIRMMPLPEGKGRWNSLATPPEFDPRSLDEMISTGEWEEVPVRRAAKDAIVRTARLLEDSGEYALSDRVFRLAAPIMDLYHGTDQNIDPHDLQPRMPPYNGSIGEGVYFGANRETAEFYANHGYPLGKGKVLQRQMDIRNPLVIDGAEEINYRVAPEFAEDVEYDQFDSIFPTERIPPFDVLIDGVWCEVRSGHDMRNIGYWAQQAGHDAIIFRNVRWTSGPNEEVLVLPSHHEFQKGDE